MSKTVDLIKGDIFSSLIKLSIPIMLANLLQIAYQLVDTFFVGKLGATSLAAVSLTFPIFFFIVSFVGGLTIAATVLVSQNKGREDMNKVNHISSQTIIFLSILALVFSILGYFVTPKIVMLLGASQDVFLESVSYLRILFLGLVPVFLYFIFQSLLRGVGNTKTPLYIILFTLGLNIILDPIFIFGFSFIPKMGVSGAAFATVLCQTISAIIGMVILLKGNHGIKISFSKFKPDFKTFSDILKLGLPVSLEQSAISLALMFMTVLIAKFGTDAIAAYGIGSRTLSLFFIPAQGFSIAVSAFVGQNFGAGKIDRAKKAIKMICFFLFFVMGFFGLLIFIFSKQIAMIFINDNLNVINLASVYLKILALSFAFIGVSEVLRGSFRGFGRTNLSMIISLIELWVLRFPFAYLMAFVFGFNEMGIWYSFPVSFILSTFLAIAVYFLADFDKTKINKESKLLAKVEDEVILEEGVNA